MKIWIILPIIALTISFTAWSYRQHPKAELTENQKIDLEVDSPKVISIDGFYMDDMEMTRINPHDMLEHPQIAGRAILNYGNKFDEMLRPLGNGQISLQVCLNEDGGIKDIKPTPTFSSLSDRAALEAFMKYFKKVAKFEPAASYNCGTIIFETKDL